MEEECRNTARDVSGAPRVRLERPSAAGMALLSVLLVSLCSSAAAEECPSVLPEHNGTQFLLNITTCSPSLLQLTLYLSDDDYVFNAKVSCRDPNGTEHDTPFLTESSVNPSSYCISINHTYPLGTVCHLTGNSHKFFSSVSQSLQNASCIISPTSSTNTHTTGSAHPTSTTITASTNSLLSSPSLTRRPPTFHPPSMPASPTVTLSSHSSSRAHQSTPHPHPEKKEGLSRSLVAVVAVGGVLLLSAVFLCLLFLSVFWCHSHSRKILKVGTDNWRSEALEMDYHPVDLHKPLAPAFSSTESLINTISLSHHPSLTLAPLPLSTHGTPPPTDHQLSGTLPHNDPFLCNLPLTCDREGEARTDSSEEETSAASGNTSGYSTGCASDNGLLNRTATSTASAHLSSETALPPPAIPDAGSADSALEDVTSAPRNGGSMEANDGSRYRGDPLQFAGMNSDASAGVEGEGEKVQTLTTSSVTATETVIPSLLSLSTSGNSESTTDNAAHSCSLATAPGESGEPAQLGSDTRVGGLTSTNSDSSPSTGSRGSPGTAGGQREEERMEDSNTIAGEETKTEEGQPSLNHTARGKDTGSFLETDVPHTRTACKQRRTVLHFVFLQGVGVAESRGGVVHQHSSSSSSSGNGSGSLVDYAGYLHIQSPV